MPGTTGQSILDDVIVCVVCDDPAVAQVMTEGAAGAGNCPGHRHIVCLPCADFIARKGCPDCFF